jgi:polysaccharide pyruvyl transferase WcaK-like protein
MLLLKILPFTRKRFTNHKSTLSEILSADVICDITGGDSFSDIYGMQRLVRGYFLKRLCQMTGRPFVMLPQTYGPFKSRFAEKLARKVLEKSSIIYSRDAEGIRVVEQLLGSSDKIMLCPDVAFILDAVRPHHDQADRIDALRAEGYRIIGLNISGLLLNGGYTRDNMFDLICDYQLLIRNIISYFTSQDKCIVMLVPHVISEEMEIENDLNACRTIFQMLPASERDRVLVLDGRYDQNQVKYFIGQCEFFMGSRMHSTIAAISQCIPAAGLAYSKKFIGVFRTVAVEDCVVDLRTLSHEKAKNEIERIYEHRDDIHQKLLTVIPEVKQKIFSIFESIQI